MSIQEIHRKINTFLGDDIIFFSLLIVLVAITSFGLGRGSIDPSVVDDHSASASAPQPVTSTASIPTKTMQVATEAPGKYVASKNSNKYHLPWCSGAKRIADENKIWFTSKEKASSAGYAPAGNCKGI